MTSAGLTVRGRPRLGRFLRHLGEMMLAMIVGMVVLGMVFRQIHLLAFGNGFEEAWQEHTELAVFAMAFNMTLPMVLWMHHRGRSWERGAEMAAAMFVPAFALLALMWLGVTPADVVLPLQMVLMVPSMIVAMVFRLDEYTEPHVVAPARALQGA